MVFRKLIFCPILALTLFFLLTAFAQTPPAPTSLFGTNILAHGNGVEVRQSQLDDLFIAFKVSRVAVGQPVQENLRRQIESELLEKLIVFQLCEARATEADRTEAKKRAEQVIAVQIKQAGSEDTLDRQLRTVALTPEMFRAQLLQQATFETVVERELRSTIEVTDSETRAYFTNNPAYFAAPERIRVSHIFISKTNSTTGQPLTAAESAAKMRVAESLRNRAKGGENFGTLVQNFSEDSASKARSGVYVFARAKDDPAHAFPAEFEAVAFTLTTNQISDVVVTQAGFHIIKFLEQIPARKVDFAQAEPIIRQGLSDDKLQKALPAYVARLKAEAGVQILKRD